MSASAPKIQDWVIDTDTHIAEPGDLWTSRLPAKYKGRGPNIVLDPNTASLPANLFAQSWVPDENERRVPNCAKSAPMAGDASVLKAVGLPM